MDIRVIDSPILDTCISAVAAIISLFAIILSFMSYRQTNKLTKNTISLQKKHNVDEVRPVVCIHLSDDPMSVTLKNHGLGPAFITSMKWSTSSACNEGENTLLELYDRDLKKSRPKIYFDYIYTKPFLNNPDDPDVLAPLEELSLFKIMTRHLTPEERTNIALFLKDTIVEIRYTDSYNSDTWSIKKNMSWFNHLVF